MRYALKAVVKTRPIEISLIERARRVKPSEGANASLLRARAFTREARSELEPTATFSLTIDRAHGPARRRWTDSRRRGLEAVLVEIILGLEDASGVLLEEDRRLAEQRRAWEAERARKEAEARRAAREQALGDDLAKTIAAWEEARRIRAFLGALEEAIPPEGRSSVYARWVTWAKGRAEAIDPLGEPLKVPKSVDLDPGDGLLGRSLEPRRSPPEFRHPPTVPVEMLGRPGRPRQWWS
jgi:hypothetical protein